jgi:hypothetical protein
MSGRDDQSVTSGSPSAERVFYSANSATEFLNDLRDMLTEQHQQNLVSQEAFANNINAPIQQMTATLRELLQLLRPTSRSPTGTPAPTQPRRATSHDREDNETPTPDQPQTTPVPVGQPQTTPAPTTSTAYTPGPRQPTPVSNTRILPVREMTAFTTNSSQAATSESRL